MLAGRGYGDGETPRERMLRQRREEQEADLLRSQEMLRSQNSIADTMGDGPSFAYEFVRISGIGLCTQENAAELEQYARSSCPRLPSTSAPSAASRSGPRARRSRSRSRSLSLTRMTWTPTTWMR